MRKLPAVLAVLGLSALTLVGCSSSATASCEPAVSADTSAVDLVDVSGSADAAPDVTVHTPFRSSDLQYRSVSDGEGTPITSADQLVVIDVSLTDGTTGTNLVTTPYDGDLSRVFALSRWDQTIPGLSDALHCASAGSRVVLAVPSGGVEEQTAAGIGVGEDDSVVAVIDVRKVYLGKADGADQYNQSFGLPTVVRAENGRPGIIVPDNAPPSDLIVQVLKKGDGEEVTSDTPVRVAYTGVVWADRSVFDTTWDGEPQPLTLSSTVPGFEEALVGQTVGSQILAVIPPDQGYGDTDQGSIPAGSTLVFVVDILGIDAPAAGTAG